MLLLRDREVVARCMKDGREFTAQAGPVTAGAVADDGQAMLLGDAAGALRLLTTGGIGAAKRRNAAGT